ncbi:single-stranded DNA exonuclease RecJ [Helicobacter didelphidarum]|uniref:Single-stranded DNA exonuclease RecJ n=2 Tax=Helicobacter didelphidarum TaxID=2040648 RepID=A0A3D8ILW7_9HELI|nr:single-stranded DNA exonuclease RecJ [Helicobacter didelphidarum]
MGIKFIITDHHTLEIDSKNKLKIPPCDFLINPQQKECGFPYKDICGSLVAWYFCCGIKINIQKVYQNPSMLFHNDIQNNLESIKMNNTYWDKDSKAPSAMQNVKTTTNISYKKIKKKANLYVSNLADTRMEEFLLLVGIAIISDVMPLNALNHTICRYALKNFTKSKKSAIQILIEFLNCKIDSQALGFKLIPLLNAAGRIDDGKIALDFLRSKSILEAKQYFKKLKALNMKRKQLQDEVTHEAFEAIGRFKQNSHIICAVGDDWHEGVLGIVAGKMTNDFKKPCFALTNINGVCKGSGRSYGNIDLISSMQSLGHLTNRHGGHIGAVGLEIPYDNIQEFINSFRPVTRNLEKPQNILGILPPNLVTHELLHCIELFEPYGNGNPTPKFFLELKIIDYRRTAQGFLEFKLDCGQDSLGNTQIIKGMFFNSQYATYPFRCGNILHFCAMVAPDMQISHQQQYRAMTNRDNIMLIIEGIYGI